MSQKIEVKLVALAADTRKLFDEGDALFTEKRKSLDLDFALSPDNYLSAKERPKCRETLLTYQSQLSMEKEFYEKTSEQFTTKIGPLLEEDEEMKELFLSKSMPGILAGQQLRLKINAEKALAIEKALEMISLYGSKSLLSPNGIINLKDNPEWTKKVERLNNEIDGHINNQYQLAMEQRKQLAENSSQMKQLMEKLWNR